MYFCYAQSCLTLCNPMVCSLSGSSVQGSSQARILEWVTSSYSRRSSRSRDQTHISCVSCIGRRILYHCTSWEAYGYTIVCDTHIHLLKTYQLFPNSHSEPVPLDLGLYKSFSDSVTPSVSSVQSLSHVRLFVTP